jgi:ADP-heptose:LPS heptosyltransferase
LRAVTGAEVAVHPFRGMREREHAAAYYARCAGIVPAAWNLALSPEAVAWARRQFRAADERGALVVHSGSGSSAKNWSGFPALAKLWRSHGTVIWVVGPADKAVAIARDDRAVRDPSLPQLAALLRHAPLYVGNDSGVSHLAGLAGARGLALFGASDPIAWAPAGLHVLQGGTECDACGTPFCTHRLGVDLTYAILRSLRPAC